MSVEFTERTLAVWYADIGPPNNPEGNWVASIEQVLDGANYELTYRFRWYRDEKIFDSDDERSGATLRNPELDKLIETCRAWVALHAARGSKTYELMRGSDSMQQFFERLRTAPFAHVKQVSKEEYESYSPKKRRGKGR
jgi:hypothetical protein